MGKRSEMKDDEEVISFLYNKKRKWMYLAAVFFAGGIIFATASYWRLSDLITKEERTSIERRTDECRERAILVLGAKALISIGEGVIHPVVEKDTAMLKAEIAHLRRAQKADGCDALVKADDERHHIK